jgi:hypothetical protein
VSFTRKRTPSARVTQIRRRWSLLNSGIGSVFFVIAVELPLRRSTAK